MSRSSIPVLILFPERSSTSEFTSTPLVVGTILFKFKMKSMGKGSRSGESGRQTVRLQWCLELRRQGGLERMNQDKICGKAVFCSYE